MLPHDAQLISGDDHVIEHPRVWTDRLPQRFQADGPRVVELPGGTQGWSFEGTIVPTIGLKGGTR